MNEIATIDTMSDNLDALYSVIDTGPTLAKARINRDSSVEVGGELVSNIPVPSIALEHPEHGDVYSADVYIRVFLDTMQTAVFDAALDWHGGDKCGWIPSKEKEKLRGVDPIAYANATKVKLYRHIFGLMRMEKPMIPGSSDKVEINEVPFRMKLGPSNFMEVSKVIKAMMHQQSKPYNHEMKISFKLEKRGSNKWFVLKYQPILTKMHPLTDETRGLITDFVDLVKRENDQVSDRMRENSETKTDDDFSDIIEG